MKFINSSSKDPYFNQLIEEELLYQSIDDFLMMYVNRPSVFLGKFQNPWLECDLHFLQSNHFDLVRRISGGGCVFHDEGNLSIALITGKDFYDGNSILKNIINFFYEYKIQVSLGDKFDLLQENYKISGSAFRQTRNRVLHHFTILFDTNLDHLQKSLSPTICESEVSTQARPSRRSKVKNIASIKSSSWDSISEFKFELIHYLKLIYQFSESDFKINHFNPKNNWEHLFGNTPEFTFRGYLIKDGRLPKNLPEKLEQSFRLALPNVEKN